MKKIMTLVAAVIVFATVNASNNSIESVVDSANRIAPFNEVNVNVPARIILVQGAEYGVMVNNAYLESTPMLDYSVRDGVLYISTNSADVFETSGRETVITIITPSADTEISVGNDMEPLRRKR